MFDMTLELVDEIFASDIKIKYILFDGWCTEIFSDLVEFHSDGMAC